MDTRRAFLQAGAWTAAGALLAGIRLPAAENAGSPAAGAPRVLADWHSHYLSQAEIDFLKQRRTPPRLLQEADGSWRIDSPPTASSDGGGFRSVTRSNIDARIRQLDQHGVQRQLLTQTLPMGFDATLPIEEQRTLFRAFNDELATVVARHPARFLAVAALPSADPAWAAAELRRAQRELKFIGGSLPLNAFATLRSASTLVPLFQEAQRLGSHLFVHRAPASGLLPDQPAVVIPQDTGFARWNLINGTHLTAAGITLGLTDFLDPYPDVSVEIVMLAGFLPHLLDSWVAAGRDNGVQDPLAKLRRLYLDTGPYSRTGEWVAQAARKLGADRILFGTDYGVGGGDRGDLGPSIASLDAALTSVEKQRIYIENSRELLKAKGFA